MVGKDNRRKPWLDAQRASEFIGTFFLVAAYLFSPKNMAPFIIGFTVVAMTYTSVHVSGAQFNPAVTFALWIRGRVHIYQVWPYIITQLAASALAIAVWYFFMDFKAHPYAPSPEFFQVIFAEAIGTFALIYVLLQVSTSEAIKDNQFSGLATGLVLAGVYWIFGEFSGAHLNPAVTLSKFATGHLGFWFVPLYIFFQLIAAAGAAYSCAYVNEFKSNNSDNSANEG